MTQEYRLTPDEYKLMNWLMSTKGAEMRLDFDLTSKRRAPKVTVSAGNQELSFNDPPADVEKVVNLEMVKRLYLKRLLWPHTRFGFTEAGNEAIGYHVDLQISRRFMLAWFHGEVKQG